MAIDTPNEVTLRGVERDAEAVMDVDPAGAHCVLGAVAGVRRDAERVREHFRIALQHANSFVTHHNYSIALAMLDEWPDSLEAAETAHEMAPGNTVVLAHAIECAVEAGRFRMAQAYCDRLNALRPTEAPHAATVLLDGLVGAFDTGVIGETNARRVSRNRQFPAARGRCAWHGNTRQAGPGRAAVIPAKAIRQCRSEQSCGSERRACRPSRLPGRSPEGPRAAVRPPLRRRGRIDGGRRFEPRLTDALNQKLLASRTAWRPAAFNSPCPVLGRRPRVD